MKVVWLVVVAAAHCSGSAWPPPPVCTTGGGAVQGRARTDQPVLAVQLLAGLAVKWTLVSRPGSTIITRHGDLEPVCGVPSLVRAAPNHCRKTLVLDAAWACPGPLLVCGGGCSHHAGPLALQSSGTRNTCPLGRTFHPKPRQSVVTVTLAIGKYNVAKLQVLGQGPRHICGVQSWAGCEPATPGRN